MRQRLEQQGMNPSEVGDALAVQGGIGALHCRVVPRGGAAGDDGGLPRPGKSRGRSIYCSSSGRSCRAARMRSSSGRRSARNAALKPAHHRPAASGIRCSSSSAAAASSQAVPPPPPQPPPPPSTAPAAASAGRHLVRPNLWCKQRDAAHHAAPAAQQQSARCQRRGKARGQAAAARHARLRCDPTAGSACARAGSGCAHRQRWNKRVVGRGRCRRRRCGRSVCRGGVVGSDGGPSRGDAVQRAAERAYKVGENAALLVKAENNRVAAASAVQDTFPPR